VRAGRIRPIEKSNDLIGNRTRDLYLYKISDLKKNTNAVTALIKCAPCKDIVSRMRRLYKTGYWIDN
jgi:hypothetical protein